MTIQRKLSILLVVVFTLIIGSVVVMTMNRRITVQQVSEELNDRMLIQIEQEMHRNLIGISQGLSQAMVAVIDEKKETLRSAAVTIQTLEAENSYDLLELRELAVGTRVDEIQLTDAQGQVINATRFKDIGTSLVDVSDRYKMVLDSQVIVLPTDLYLDSSDDKVYLATAVPRKNQSGILNVLSEAADVEETISTYAKTLKGFQRISLIDNDNKILFDIHETDYSSELVPSQVINTVVVAEVFETEQEMVIIDGGIASIYYPVMTLGTVDSVLEIQLDTEPYMVLAGMSNDGIEDIKTSLNMEASIQLAVLVCFLVIGTVIIIGMVRQVLGPLKAMTAVTEQVAKGNLSVSHTYDSNDEVGTLSKSFNRMIVDLRAMTLEIMNSSVQLQEKASDIQASVISISDVNEEINFSIDNMAMGAASQVEESSETLKVTRELSANLSFIRGSLEIMEEMIRKVEENIQSLEEAAENSGAKNLDQIEQARSSIENLVDGTLSINREVEQILKLRSRVLEYIENITTVSEESAAFIEEVNASVEEQSEEVQSVVSVVEELKTMADHLVESVDRYVL